VSGIEDRVGLTRRVYEGWANGDPDPVREGLDDDMAWDFSAYPIPDGAERGKGRENYLRFVGDFSATWARHELTYTDFIELGDVVVVGLHETMEAAGGALSLERDVAHACTVRDGRIVLVRAYRSTEDALRAVERGE
jgi:ketosteroid isomerase-like protein